MVGESTTDCLRRDMVDGMKIRPLPIAAAVLAGWFGHSAYSNAAVTTRVFELRTYTTEPGRLPALLARFQNHTLKLFEKHGMVNIGYWVPQDDPAKKNTLIYIIAHKDRDTAQKSWNAFRTDPEWIKVRTASEAPENGGKIVSKVDSVFMDPVVFSGLK